MVKDIIAVAILLWFSWYIGIGFFSYIIYPLFLTWPTAKKLEREGKLIKPIPFLTFVYQPIVFSALLVGSVFFINNFPLIVLVLYLIVIALALTKVIVQFPKNNPNVESDFEDIWSKYLKSEIITLFDIEKAHKIINVYGQVVEKTANMNVVPNSLLPYPKEEIKRAIKLCVENLITKGTFTEKDKDFFEVGYIQLSNFVKDADAKFVEQWFNVENFSQKLDKTTSDNFGKAKQIMQESLNEQGILLKEIRSYQNLKRQ